MVTPRRPERSQEARVGELACHWLVPWRFLLPPWPCCKWKAAIISISKMLWFCLYKAMEASPAVPHIFCGIAVRCVDSEHLVAAQHGCPLQIALHPRRVPLTLWVASRDPSCDLPGFHSCPLLSHPLRIHLTPLPTKRCFVFSKGWDLFLVELLTRESSNF